MTPEEEAAAVLRLIGDMERVLSGDRSGIVARAIGATIGRVIYGLVEIAGREAGSAFGEAVDAAACSTLDDLRNSATRTPVRH